jgi:hypothetical protein
MGSDPQATACPIATAPPVRQRPLEMEKQSDLTMLLLRLGQVPER